MPQNWYFRLLISYFPVFLFTISILIFVSFIVVNDISRSETEKADKISTGYTVDSVNRIFQEAEMTVLNEAATNRNYVQFLDMNALNSDSFVAYNVVNSVRTIEKNNAFIDSIYLFRISDRTVLTSSGIKDLDSFRDRSFVRQALGNAKYRGWSAVRELPGNSEDKRVKVISMYKQTPLPFGTEGLLVINVSEHEIGKFIDQTVNHQVSFLRVADNRGNEIYPSDVRGDDGASGKVLTAMHSATLNWEFESGIKAGQLFAWVSVISYVWVLIALLTVAFAIFYFIYVTRKNYKPIQLMMRRIQAVQIRGEGSSNKRDELSLIDHALSSLIDQTTAFEKEHRENLLVKRRQLFLDLIGGEWSESMHQRLQKLSPLAGMQEEAQYIVVVAEINRYDEFQSFYSSGDQNVLKFALMNVLQELARNENLHGWVEWINGNRSGIILKASEEEHVVKERILAAVDNSRKWVAEHLRIWLSFGVGSTVTEPGVMNQSYKRALSALEHKLSLGKDAVIMSDELPSNTAPEMFKYLQLIADCVQDFRMTSDGWRQRLEQMFAMLIADGLRDEDIRTLLQALLQMLGRELKDLSEGLREHFTGDNAVKWQHLLRNASTLGEMQSVLLDYLTDIYRTYVAVCETKSHRAMIGEMRSYIVEHFANPDLSLKHLSDRFQISGKYASHLFKIEFDMKFVDFLVQLRMQRAEELLFETEESVQYIALQVGYANSITFGRVFKRVTGVTPGDFRKLKMRPSAAHSLSVE
ncbi:helix-turn-helix domain-containing protein [Paenibacillus sp. R14(2021)]|uniref:helix-turn-helix domain-containing protein n=1 Tax=Paenibacillus sp. R14(2021) TaxID=2859228 RepID=UPI001C6125FB|nr:helix-turn-helix domain-containing protein [Paenibacillus sp. R14(2021)]